MHNRGILHRDIQLGNCVTGLGPDANTIYMIDFGFSKFYIDQYTRRHIPDSRAPRDFIGNYWFSSVRVHCRNKGAFGVIWLLRKRPRVLWLLIFVLDARNVRLGRLDFTSSTLRRSWHLQLTHVHPSMTGIRCGRWSERTVIWRAIGTRLALCFRAKCTLTSYTIVQRLPCTANDTTHLPCPHLCHK